jgi:hypothetical protein
MGIGENTNAYISNEHLLRNFFGKATTPDYTSDERPGRGSSNNLSCFVMHTSRVCLFVSFLDRRISFQEHLVLLCLRAPLIRVIIYEPVQDLHDCGGAFAEEFCR